MATAEASLAACGPPLPDETIREMVEEWGTQPEDADLMAASEAANAFLCALTGELGRAAFFLRLVALRDAEACPGAEPERQVSVLLDAMEGAPC